MTLKKWLKSAEIARQNAALKARIRKLEQQNEQLQYRIEKIHDLATMEKRNDQ